MCAKPWSEAAHLTRLDKHISKCFDMNTPASKSSSERFRKWYEKRSQEPGFVEEFKEYKRNKMREYRTKRRK